jgi:DUF971 family protein
MAGLDSNTPIPVSIVLHQISRVLELAYEDGRSFRLPVEYLRVYSPSAEVRGHGPGQETLQTGKAEVEIESIDAVGHYAIQPRFSDGHSTGIYSWDYLYDLALNQGRHWADYLRRLEAVGASRHLDASGGAALPGRQAGSGQSAASSHPAGFQSSAVSRPRGGCG